MPRNVPVELLRRRLGLMSPWASPRPCGIARLQEVLAQRGMRTGLPPSFCQRNNLCAGLYRFLICGNDSLSVSSVRSFSPLERFFRPSEISCRERGFGNLKTHLTAAKRWFPPSTSICRQRKAGSGFGLSRHGSDQFVEARSSEGKSPNGGRRKHYPYSYWDNWLAHLDCEKMGIQRTHHSSFRKAPRRLHKSKSLCRPR